MISRNRILGIILGISPFVVVLLFSYSDWRILGGKLAVLGYILFAIGGLVLQRHMIMNYPEYNNVNSRFGYPGLATSAAFAEYDVLLPADCVFDGIGLSRLLDNKPVSEPMVESSEQLPIPMPHSEPVRRSDTNSVEFFSLRD